MGNIGSSIQKCSRRPKDQSPVLWRSHLHQLNFGGQLICDIERDDLHPPQYPARPGSR